MKKILFLLLILAAANYGTAQTSTYILLRHAEKDTLKNNPPLTKDGEIRAQKLLEILKEYKPDLIYSTNYNRTRATVAPLAKKFNTEILLYDPANLQSFADQLLLQKGKTIVVAGHSNTTPALVNLLIHTKTYPDLPDNVYNQFWIVTVTDGKAIAKLVTY